MREFYLVLQDIGSVLGGNLARRTNREQVFYIEQRPIGGCDLLGTIYIRGQSERCNKKDWRWVMGFSR